MIVDDHGSARVSGFIVSQGLSSAERWFLLALAQRRSLQGDAVRRVDDAVEDGVGDGGVLQPRVPGGHGELAGDQRGAGARAAPAGRCARQPPSGRRRSRRAPARRYGRAAPGAGRSCRRRAPPAAPAAAASCGRRAP